MTDDELRRRWRPALDAAVPWEPPAVPTLVVVPHPDDESLLHGALLAAQAARGVPVTVVAVTDGEAAYADRDLDVDLPALRRREQAAALHELGLAGATVERLGLPDSGVDETDPRLRGLLAELVPAHGLVVAPWVGEPHRDHAACGRAARTALADSDGGAVLALGLFWTWHGRAPADLAGVTLRAQPVNERARRRRAAAVAAHRSQVSDEVTEPLLDEDDLRPLSWSHEHHVVEESR